MKRLMLIALLMVFCAVSTGCGRLESKLIGKWEGKTGSFVFMKDKTGVINPPAGIALPRNVQFKWSVQGSDTVRIDVGPPVGKTYFGKMESGDALVIEDEKFVKQ